MSKYQEALQEVKAGECFAGCMMDQKDATPAGIAELIASIAADVQRGLEQLAGNACPYDAAGLLDELATQADIMRVLAAARLKLLEAAAEDAVTLH